MYITKTGASQNSIFVPISLLTSVRTKTAVNNALKEHSSFKKIIIFKYISSFHYLLWTVTKSLNKAGIMINEHGNS